MRQVSQYHTRHIQLNVPQAIVTQAPQPLQFLEWGRGTGKTTILGYDYSEILHTMPRATTLLIGPSYQFTLTRILPSFVQGLEMFGIYKDLHYFVGKLPPRSWRRTWGTAYQPPEKFNNYITYWNGLGTHLISHDVKGDGRGLNSDVVHGDEAALLDPEKLQENTDPTRRGTNTTAFKGKKYFGFRRYSSSTPITQAGAWMLDYEEKALKDPNKILYLKATCRHNLHNLRPGYLEEARESAYREWIYLAEYEGIRPAFTRNGFYPLFSVQRHTYIPEARDGVVGPLDTPTPNLNCLADSDLTPGQPLILSVDWGAAINSLTINQYLKSINEYRTLRNMYALGSDQKIQDDLFAEFHTHYAPHQGTNATIFLWYDNTGNVRTGNTRVTRAEQAQAQLTKLGWKVQLMTTGQSNPMHELKYLLWTYIMREDNPLLPRYRMNRLTTRELQASMGNAGALKSSTGLIQKDKSSERRAGRREHATDLSDANDCAPFGMFQHLLHVISSALPDLRIGTR